MKSAPYSRRMSHAVSSVSPAFISCMCATILTIRSKAASFSMRKQRATARTAFPTTPSGDCCRTVKWFAIGRAQFLTVFYSRTPVRVGNNRLALATILVALLASFFTIGCGDTGEGDGQDAETDPAPTVGAGLEGSAGDAVLALMDMVDKGQWGREWEHLHPEQQAFISKELYQSCGEASDIPNIDDVSVVETYEEEITIPGTETTVSSTAVTVSLQFSQGTEMLETEDTFHVSELDGRWRWFLGDAETYRAGECP